MANDDSLESEKKVEPIIISLPSSGEPKKKRSPRKKKDPNAPAGAASAYTIFFRDTQSTIKSQNPVRIFVVLSVVAPVF